MSTDVARSWTADEFARLRDWKRFELVDGRLVPFRIGARASHTCGRLLSELVNWSRPARQAWVFSSGASYCCFPGRPNTVRRP